MRHIILISFYTSLPYVIYAVMNFCKDPFNVGCCRTVRHRRPKYEKLLLFAGFLLFFFLFLFQHARIFPFCRHGTITMAPIFIFLFPSNWIYAAPTRVFCVANIECLCLCLFLRNTADTVYSHMNKDHRNANNEQNKSCEKVAVQTLWLMHYIDFHNQIINWMNLSTTRNPERDPEPISIMIVLYRMVDKWWHQALQMYNRICTTERAKCVNKIEIHTRKMTKANTFAQFMVSFCHIHLMDSDENFNLRCKYISDRRDHWYLPHAPICGRDSLAWNHFRVFNKIHRNDT